jgi:hypothetical protein
MHYGLHCDYTDIMFSLQLVGLCLQDEEINQTSFLFDFILLVYLKPVLLSHLV